MFFVSFGILVLCKSLRENDGIYVELQRNGQKNKRSSQAKPRTKRNGRRRRKLRKKLAGTWDLQGKEKKK
jgi:hypothetical protein